MANVEVKWVFPGAKEAKEAIDKINQSVAKTGEEAKKSSGEMGGAIDANLVSLAKWAAGFATVAAAADFIKDSIAEAREAEKSTAALAAQVERAGVPWKKYGEQIQAAIDSAATYAAVQDDDVSKALQKMIMMTDDVRGSVQNLNLVTDLATASNIGLEQAAELVGKAIEGDLEALSRYLPQAKDLSKSLGSNASEATKAAAGLNLIKDAAGGANDKMTTVERSTREYDLAMADLKKTIGDIFLPIIPPLNAGLKSIVDNIKEQITPIQEATGWWDKLYLAASKTYILGDIVTGSNDIIEAVKNLNKEIDFIAGTDTQGFGLLNDQMKQGAKGFKEYKTGIDALPESLRKQAAAAERAANQVKAGFEIQTKAVRDYGKSQEVIGEKILEVAKKGYGDYQEYLGRMILRDARDTADELGRIEEGKGKKIQDEAVKAFEKVARETEEAAKAFEQTWDAVALDVGHAVSGAFVYGDDFKENFENLGKHFLDTMLAKSVAWTASTIAESIGLKTAMQEIFAVPIIQPVVPTPVGGPGGASLVNIPGTGATAPTAGGMTAGQIGGAIGGAALTADAANRARTGDNGDIGMAFIESPLGAQAGLVMRGVDSITGRDEESDNQRLARHFGRDRVAMNAAKELVGVENWVRMSYSEKVNAVKRVIQLVGIHVIDPDLYNLNGSEREALSNAIRGGALNDEIALLRQVTDLKKQIDTTANPEQRNNLEDSLRDMLEGIAPQQRRLLGLKRGGIVTEEGWFNVGEMGKKEAVIPLENPQAMQMLNQAGIGGGGGVVNNHFHLSNVVMDEITLHKFTKQVAKEIQRKRFS